MKLSANEYKKARAFYASIGSVTCPMLMNEKIVFTGIGFRHLLRKGRIPRPLSEQKKRLDLLKFTPSIIGDSSAIVTKRNKVMKIKMSA